MKEELSRKEVTRDIWNGFDVCLKYRVEVGIKKYRKKREKIHILDIFGSRVQVHPSRTQCVPVHVRGASVHPVLLYQF